MEWNSSSTRNGVAIHGMEWEEKLDPRLYKRLSRTFAKKMERNECQLGGGG